ncbi:predicted protein [Naegleria gruberi]|uniref:Predicted protein n=1 Tax=Naegleria gruberi TaxID=5762 RepID=D2UX30_NAEGR|nr:uncharacterized protein NAEGRDRAFT_61616 [Naegleria gruberi]EFC50552.1 predicted protein [Naegleria gruberi]|eukprot:XP_002683296.1 predicted protein [Naegleria gruberi strain NEG-M]
MSQDHSTSLQLTTDQTNLKSIICRALEKSEIFRQRFAEKFHQTTLENLCIKSSAIDNGISNKIFTIELSSSSPSLVETAIEKNSIWSCMEVILKITSDKSTNIPSLFNKTLNEACIMKFLHANLAHQFKSPTIYDHTDGNGKGESEMDYILMEKCEGMALNLIYDELSDEERRLLISHISEMRGKLCEFAFIPEDSHGNLKETLFGSVLDIKVVNDKVAHVTVGRNSDGDGPFESFSDFLIANFEKRIEEMLKDERVSSLVYNFQQLVKYLKEKPLSISSDLYQLCHIDLTPNNVIVNPSTNHITGIIDWEWGVMTLLDMDINELMTWTRNDQEISFLKECLHQHIPQIGKNSNFWEEFEGRRKLFLALDWAIRLSSYKNWFRNDETEAESFIVKALENTKQFFMENSF